MWAVSKTILLVGGSRGIGLAAADHFARGGANLLCVSRTRSPFGTWIEADIADNTGIDIVAQAIGERPLDALLYLGGTWENGAFTAAYDFAASPIEETDRVLAVNLAAPIKLVQRLLPNLRAAAVPRCIFIGALTARDGAASREVANTASKFGLRGAAQALAIALPAIGFTLINPGNVETPEVTDDIQSGRFPAQRPIPMADLLAAVDFALTRTPLAQVREIDLAQAVSSMMRI